MKKVLSLILGGGKGTRLFPLTQKRAKPCVPFAGKFKLIDIPISNCFHAGLKQIYILTQFNSAPLHSHITNTYRSAPFDQDFVEILAAEQTYDHEGWYLGTADAVRKSLDRFRVHSPSHYLILSGDQLYRMDLRVFLKYHVQKRAQISIAVIPVTREQAADLGIVKIDESGRIVAFLEKPGPSADITDMAIGEGFPLAAKLKGEGREFLSSMGIYAFNANSLERALDNSYSDFGREVIPACLPKSRLYAYVFQGYWEDIGSIRSFYTANLGLTTISPAFNFYDEEKPIFTSQSHLPSSKVNSCSIRQSLISDGCIITNATINNSIIGSRNIIENGAYLDGVICMGNEYYETMSQKDENRKKGLPNVGIGRGTFIRRAIIDQNVRIGDGCRIGIDSIPRQDGHSSEYSIVGDIIVIAKNATIPSGTVI
jgi:glucose-1-phosphate adenylyltransferase